MPDFDLAPLDQFDPKMFLPEDKEGQPFAAFMLTLALAFNDLKTLLWLIERLKDGTPKESFKVSPYWGQLNGFRIHVYRLLVAFTHEILVFIAENKEVIDSPRFNRLLSKVGPKARTYWNTIVDVALEKKDLGNTRAREFRIALEKVRSNGTYHYFNTRGVAAAYKREVESDDILTKVAYASLGDTMESTRFYFADAAAQGILRRYHIGAGGKDLFGETFALIAGIKEAFKSLVETHLRQERREALERKLTRAPTRKKKRR